MTLGCLQIAHTVRLGSVTKTRKGWSRLNTARIEPVLCSCILKPWFTTQVIKLWHCIKCIKYQDLALDVGAAAQLLDQEAKSRTFKPASSVEGAKV